MRVLLAFRKEDLEEESPIQCPVSQDLRDALQQFHRELLLHCNHPGPAQEEEEAAAQNQEEKPLSWSERLLALVASKEEEKTDGDGNTKPGTVIPLFYNPLF